MNEKIYIIKHVEDEGPGLLGDFFRHLGWESVLVELYRGEALLYDLESPAGVIVLGGPMNVYQEEDYPFLKMEDQFIRKMLKEEVPLLGICLGAQLLAKACGARVHKSPWKEIGWYEVELTREGQRDALFRGLGRDLCVFQWHEDTFEIPKGGALLATADPCPNQAFKVGPSAYGLQFHVEVTLDMVKVWAEKERQAVSPARLEREGAALRGRLETQAQTIFANFQRRVESALRVKKTVDLFVGVKEKRKTELWWSQEKRTLIGGDCG